MYIIITRTMDIEQVSFEVFCIGIWRAGNKIRPAFGRNSHITLLVGIIVSQLVSNSGNGNTGFKDFGILKHKVKR